MCFPISATFSSKASLRNGHLIIQGHHQGHCCPTQLERLLSQGLGGDREVTLVPLETDQLLRVVLILGLFGYTAQRGKAGVAV